MRKRCVSFRGDIVLAFLAFRSRYSIDEQIPGRAGQGVASQHPRVREALLAIAKVTNGLEGFAAHAAAAPRHLSPVFIEVEHHARRFANGLRRELSYLPSPE